jgi:hypothetical protein
MSSFFHWILIVAIVASFNWSACHSMPNDLPFAPEPTEQRSSENTEFAKKCYELWKGLNPGAKLRRFTVSSSERWGEVWRAEFSEEINSREIAQLMVCWRLPGHSEFGTAITFLEGESDYLGPDAISPPD